MYLRIVSYLLYLYSQLISIIDILLLSFPKKGKEYYNCIVVRTDGIGDFVIWADVAYELQKRYESVLYICPTTYSEYVKELGMFTKVIGMDRSSINRSLCYNVKFMIKLRQYESCVVYNPMKSHHGFSDYIVGMVSSEKKIGIKVNRKGYINYIKDSVYTRLLEVPEKSVFLINQSFVRLTFLPDYSSQIANFKENTNCYYNKSKKAKYCFVSLSSSVRFRIWPMNKLAKCLISLPSDWDIVLSGHGKEDEERASYVIKSYEGNSKIINIVNKTDLSQMVHYIANADLVLGNDSAAIHIAAAYRVPSICYAPGVTFNEFVPYPKELPDNKYHPQIVSVQKKCFGCHGKCYKKLHATDIYPCLDEITEEMVIERILSLLRNDKNE